MAKVTRDSVYTFLASMHMEAMKSQQYEQCAFDPIATETMYMIYGKDVEADKPQHYSSSMLAKMSRSTVKRVRTRLKHLARYGIIRVETPWRND